jgi:hypothetical protein
MRVIAAILLFAASAALTAQQSILPSGLGRLAGTDESSHIEYVRLFLDGTLLSPLGASVGAQASQSEASAKPKATALPGGRADGSTSLPSVSATEAGPMLIAQCTRSSSGKLFFELLTNFGGVKDLAYYPPWRPANDHDLFPPQLPKPMITMEFLGYTHVKPVKRQWETLTRPMGQYRYNPPSGGSSNMEDSTYYLRYLLALPTLRLTLADKAAEFRTTPLLDQIRKEPLCKASLL